MFLDLKTIADIACAYRFLSYGQFIALFRKYLEITLKSDRGQQLILFK